MKINKRWAWVLCFIVFWSCISIYLVAIRIHVQFLYCESGWFLEWAAAPRDALRFWFTNLATKAYNGHYTPLAFGLELIEGHLLGSHERLWTLRQAGALAFLGTGAAVFVHTVAGGAGPRPWLAAIPAAVIFMAQPALISLVAWPFMVMQMACLALAFACMAGLSRFVAEPSPRKAALCLFGGYATMHLFGVGAAFSGAILIVIGCLVLREWRQGRPPGAAVLACLAAVACLSFGHGLVMLFRSNDTAQVHVGLDFLLANFGVFAGHILFYGARSLWMPGDLPLPDPRSFVVDNLYGWALCAALVVTALLSLRNATSVQARQTAAVLTFLTLAFFLYTAMIAVRANAMPRELQGLLFAGGRYVVFGAFFAFSFAVLLATRAGCGAASALPVLALGAVLANAAFVTRQLPWLWPGLMESSTRTWSDVKRQSAEALAAGVPVPDSTFKAGECTMHVHDFARLLRRDLGLSPTATLDWAK